MTERLLTTASLAAMLDMSPGMAVDFMARQGIHPIDLGVGRGRGRRWLESVVRQTLRELHEKAQPKPRKVPRHRQDRLSVPLHEMSVSDIYQLTRTPCVQ